MEAQAAFSEAKLSARELLPLHQVGSALPPYIATYLSLRHFPRLPFFWPHLVMYSLFPSTSTSHGVCSKVLFLPKLTYDFPFTLFPFVFQKVKREWPEKADAWLLPISPACGHWEPVWWPEPITPPHSEYRLEGMECNGPVRHMGGQRVAAVWCGLVEDWKDEKERDERGRLLWPAWSNLASSIWMCNKGHCGVQNWGTASKCGTEKSSAPWRAPMLYSVTE